jgi:hypothetical protein
MKKKIEIKKDGIELKNQGKNNTIENIQYQAFKDFSV